MIDPQGIKPPWMSEQHELFADTVRGFFARELTPNIERWREDGIVSRDFWLKSGEMGLLGATIPEAYGGSGGPLSLDAITAYEQARAGDSGWGFSIQTIVAHYLVTYGTEAQKNRWLPRVASGEMVTALAMTEPGTGSDVQAIQTTARAEGDAYTVNGAKTFITNGQLADLVLLAVRTGSEPGARGVSLLAVETAEAEGFKRGRNLKKMGMKGADTSELFFEDVRVPKDNLLGGAEGQGFAQLMKQLPWERLVIGIIGLGASAHALEETLGYVKERRAFGKRIYDFQNTRFKLAEAKTKLEVTRSFIFDCIGRIDEGKLDPATASMAKWWGTQVQNEIADECLQLFGGYGYMMEYPIASAFVDARVQKIYGGTNEIMKELIARALDD